MIAKKYLDQSMKFLLSILENLIKFIGELSFPNKVFTYA